MDSFRSSCTDASSEDASMTEIADDDHLKLADVTNVNSGSNSELNQFAVTEFNKNRKIIIRNVPPCTYEEVKDFLTDYGVSNMSISKKSRHAIVTLLHGEEAEDIVAVFDCADMLGMEVEVALYPNEAMLCVAHLPSNINDQEFRDMVEAFGAVEKCFLMRNPSTGKSQGYGFVEFMHNRENTDKVRGLLDGRKVGSCTLRCDFVPDNLLSFSDLSSKCLLVDHLPSDYKNNVELKNVFSRVVTPVFCQVCVHKGEAMGFGLVEYSTPEEAMETQAMLSGYQIGKHMIRVSFCMPGKAASQISNDMLKSQLHHQPALLPQPPSTGGQSNLPGLLSHPSQPTPPFMCSTPQRMPTNVPNPGELASPIVKQLLENSAQGGAILEKFQHILQQLQDMQKPAKQGLLGDTPHGGGGESSPLLNPNLQIALLSVLLATQLQTLLPGLLGSPTMQQTLMSSLQQQLAPSLQNHIPPQAPRSNRPPPLLGNPMIAQANAMLQCLFSQDSSASPPFPPPPTQYQHTQQDTARYNQLNAFNNFNQLLDTLSQAKANVAAGPMNEQKLETRLTFDDDFGEDSVLTPPSALNPKQGLLGDKPTQDSSVSQSTAKQPLLPEPSTKPASLPNTPIKDKGCNYRTKAGLLGDSPVKASLLGARPGKCLSMPSLLGDGPSSSSIVPLDSGNIVMGDDEDSSSEVTSTTDPTPSSPQNTIVSQLNPLAPQFVPKSPGSKAMDAGDFLKDQEADNMANPLLALYIESQIRDQLAEFQMGTQPIEPPTPPSMRVSPPVLLAASASRGSKTPLLPNPKRTPVAFRKTPGRRPGMWDPPGPPAPKPPLLGHPQSPTSKQMAQPKKTLLPEPSLPQYNVQKTTLLPEPNHQQYNVQKTTLLPEPVLPQYNAQKTTLLPEPLLPQYNVQKTTLLPEPVLQQYNAQKTSLLPEPVLQQYNVQPPATSSNAVPLHTSCGMQRKGLLGDTPGGKASLLPTPPASVNCEVPVTTYAHAYMSPPIGQQQTPQMCTTAESTSADMYGGGYYSQPATYYSQPPPPPPATAPSYSPAYSTTSASSMSPAVPQAATSHTQQQQQQGDTGADGSQQWDQASVQYMQQYQTMCQQYYYQCNMAYTQMYYQQQQQAMAAQAAASATNTQPPLPPPLEQPPLPPSPPEHAYMVSNPMQQQQQQPAQQKRAHLLPSPETSPTGGYSAPAPRQALLRTPANSEQHKKRRH